MFTVYGGVEVSVGIARERGKKLWLCTDDGKGFSRSWVGRQARTVEQARKGFEELVRIACDVDAERR